MGDFYYYNFYWDLIKKLKKFLGQKKKKQNSKQKIRKRRSRKINAIR
jgi:hypothetical protein